MNPTCVARLFFVLTLAGLIVPGCSGGGSSDGPFWDYVVTDNFETTTADGVPIALHRYTRASGTAYAEPVFLSGGYLESHKVFNAFPKYSMAHTLALEGYEVWTYDIRGAGDSYKPEINWSSIDFTIDWTTLDWSFGMPGWDYSIDHFVYLDTPAALDFVLQYTGRPQVIWVAHSMGALMQYAYLQTNGSSKVKAAVTMGGIGWIQPGTDYQSLFAEVFFAIGTFLAPLLPSNLPLPLRWALDKLLGNDPLKWAAICYALDSIAGKLFWNAENINPNLIYQFLKYMLPDTTTNCFKQFMDWAADGECRLNPITFTPPATNTGGGNTGAGNTGFPVTTDPSTGTVTVGQSWNVTANLGLITTPTLVLGGSADFMCPSSFCMEVYNRLGSAKKKFLECSKANGHAVDYGHVDMAMGLNASKEIFPHVSEWVREHASSR